MYPTTLGWDRMSWGVPEPRSYPVMLRLMIFAENLVKPERPRP